MSGAGPFSIVRGGPLYRAFVAIRLLRPDGHAPLRLSLAFVSVTWVPFVALGLVEWIANGRVPTALAQLALHVRLLLAVPLSLLAESILEERCASVSMRVREQMLDAKTKTRFDSILRAAAAQRDAWGPEALILAIAVFLGLAARHGAARFDATATVAVSPPSITFSFYALVAVPLFALFMLRWLYRWLVWSVLLVRLSRVDLRPVVTHPDRAGGLDCLSEPIEAFAVFAFAVAAVAAASWWDQIRATGASLESFAPTLVTLFFVVLTFATGPLLAYMGPLHASRREAIRSYGDVLRGFVRGLESGWLHGAGGTSSPVGDEDSSHLADADSAYQNLSAMRVLPLRLVFLAEVALAVLVPMVPLIVSQLSLDALLGKVAHAALGVLPF